MGSCFLLLLFTPLESNQLTHVLIPGWGGRGGGALPYERSGMLVVSSGCKFRPLVSLRVARQNATIFSRKGRFQGCKRRNIKIYIFSIRFIYSIYVIQVFFMGQKRLGHPQLVSFRGLINSKLQTSIPALFIRESPPRGF